MQTASGTDTELGGGDMDFLVAIALLPAIVLVVYIYKKDRVERSAREDRRVTPETVSDYFQRMNW